MIDVDLRVWRLAVLLLGSENRGTARCRLLHDEVLRDCDGEQIDALLSAADLGGNAAVSVLLARWLRSGRRWVRIRPASKSLARMISGATFRAGVFYSVNDEFAGALLQEPESDRHLHGSPRFSAVFEAVDAPEDGAEVGFVW